MDTRKYFIYCRKSSESEERQVLSIPAQVKELTEYAKKKSLDIVDIIKEEKTAYRKDRPKFNQMMERIESGEADAILVWQLNRIARNSLDGGRVIYFMDEGKIKEILTPSKVYQATGDDKFIMGMEFNMAKKESDDKSENTKRGIRTKLANKELPTRAPIGYINIDENGRIAGKQYDKQKQELYNQKTAIEQKEI